MATVYWLEWDECGSSGESGATLIPKQPAEVTARSGSDDFTAGAVEAPSVNAGRHLRPPGGGSWSMSVEGESEASSTRKSIAMPKAWRRRPVIPGDGPRRRRRVRTTHKTLDDPLSPLSSLTAGPRGSGRTTAPVGATRAASLAAQDTDCAVGSGEWAEPPHSPWTLRHRVPKKAIFCLFSASRGQRKMGPFWPLFGPFLALFGALFWPFWGPFLALFGPISLLDPRARRNAIGCELRCQA